MKQLRDKVAESTRVKQSSDYINETPEHKSAYDQALQQAQSIINESSKPTLDKTVIEQKVQNLTNAQNALHGARLLDNAKNNAISEINKLSGLNDAQRQKAIQNIQAQTTIPDVNQQLTTDKELNNAMKLLRVLLINKIKFINKVTISMKINNLKIITMQLFELDKTLLIKHTIQ